MSSWPKNLSILLYIAITSAMNFTSCAELRKHLTTFFAH